MMVSLDLHDFRNFMSKGLYFYVVNIILILTLFSQFTDCFD